MMDTELDLPRQPIWVVLTAKYRKRPWKLLRRRAIRIRFLTIRVGRSEFVGKRVARISQKEVALQLLNGGEKAVPFVEITEVQVRDKDK